MRRSVRFAETVRVHVSEYTLSRVDCQMLWWTGLQRQETKKSAVEEAFAFRKYEENMRMRRTGYCNTLSKVYRRLLHHKDISSALTLDFEFWIAVAGAHRGMEKVAVDEYRKKREKQRRDLKMAILFIQSKCKTAGISDEKKLHMLRSASERLTYSSKMIAETFGAADECAARKDVQELAIDVSTRLDQILRKQKVLQTPKRRLRINPAA